MATYQIHYSNGFGIIIAVEHGRDVFAAVGSFLESRKLRQIVGVRRLINGHHDEPVFL